MENRSHGCNCYAERSRCSKNPNESYCSRKRLKPNYNRGHRLHTTYLRHATPRRGGPEPGSLLSLSGPCRRVGSLPRNGSLTPGRNGPKNHECEGRRRSSKRPGSSKIRSRRPRCRWDANTRGIPSLRRLEACRRYTTDSRRPGTRPRRHRFGAISRFDLPSDRLPFRSRVRFLSRSCSRDSPLRPDCRTALATPKGRGRKGS